MLYSVSRRLEVYANVERTPDTEIATTYYDYVSLYIDSLRMHQDKLRDEILWVYYYAIIFTVLHAYSLDSLYSIELSNKY